MHYHRFYSNDKDDFAGDHDMSYKYINDEYLPNDEYINANKSVEEGLITTEDVKRMAESYYERKNVNPPSVKKNHYSSHEDRHHYQDWSDEKEVTNKVIVPMPKPKKRSARQLADENYMREWIGRWAADERRKHEEKEDLEVRTTVVELETPYSLSDRARQKAILSGSFLTVAGTSGFPLALMLPAGLGEALVGGGLIGVAAFGATEVIRSTGRKKTRTEKRRQDLLDWLALHDFNNFNITVEQVQSMNSAYAHPNTLALVADDALGNTLRLYRGAQPNTIGRIERVIAPQNVIKTSEDRKQNSLESAEAKVKAEKKTVSLAKPKSSTRETTEAVAKEAIRQWNQKEERTRQAETELEARTTTIIPTTEFSVIDRKRISRRITDSTTLATGVSITSTAAVLDGGTFTGLVAAGVATMVAGGVVLLKRRDKEPKLDSLRRRLLEWLEENNLTGYTVCNADLELLSNGTHFGSVITALFDEQGNTLQLCRGVNPKTVSFVRVMKNPNNLTAGSKKALPVSVSSAMQILENSEQAMEQTEAEPTEAEKLRHAIAEVMVQAQGKKLSTEEDHAATRILTDMSELFRLHEENSASAATEAILLEGLQALKAEADDLLASLHNRGVKEMEAYRNYIQQRQNGFKLD